MADQYSLEVKKRPWYIWVLWVIWAIILIFLFQNAIASGGELETRASAIFWVSSAVWLVAGIVIWFTRRKKRE